MLGFTGRIFSFKCINTAQKMSGFRPLLLAFIGCVQCLWEIINASPRERVANG